MMNLILKLFNIFIILIFQVQVQDNQFQSPPIPHFLLPRLKGITIYLHNTPSTRYEYLIF